MKRRKLYRARGSGSKAYRRSLFYALPAAASAAALGAYRWYNRPSDVRTGGYTHLDKKFRDYSHSGDLVATITGSEFDPTAPLCLNGIDQGQNEGNYIGRGYDLVSVLIKGHFEWKNFASATDKYGEITRILLVLDTQTNAAQFNAEDVLDNNHPFPINAPRNLEYTHRFKVLSDKIYKQPPMGFAATGTDEFVKQPFELFYKFKRPVKVLTRTTGATVSAINDNSLHVIAFCSRGSSHCNMRYTSRVRFVG